MIFSCGMGRRIARGVPSQLWEDDGTIKAEDSKKRFDGSVGPEAVHSP